MTGVQTCALPICFPVTIGEESDWDYCGDSEVEVEIETTKAILKFNEETNDWDEVTPSQSMIYEVCFQIERYHL